jgi:membrane protein implicated in regulation of membrane protease activity
VNLSNKNSASQENPPSYPRALAWVVIIALAVILGLPLIFAGMYVAMGLNSVGYYGPPIGQVMAFYAMSATVLATAVAPIAAVVAALLAVPRFRRFLTTPVEKPKQKTENIRKAPLSTPTISEKKERPVRLGGHLLREKTKIRIGEYAHYKIKLGPSETIEGHLSSDGFFDAYFFTESSFRTFDRGGEARELEGTEDVSHYEPRFEASREGTFFLVIQNHDKKNIVVDVQLERIR